MGFALGNCWERIEPLRWVEIRIGAPSTRAIAISTTDRKLWETPCGKDTARKMLLPILLHHKRIGSVMSGKPAHKASNPPEERRPGQ